VRANTPADGEMTRVFILEQQPGLMTGYYVGLFFRFLWFLFIGVTFQTAAIYIFGFNYFTYWIMAIIISFVINTSLSIKDSYPFFRHILIYIALIYTLNYTDEYVTVKLLDFFSPDRLWSLFIIVSFLIGIMVTVGRYGNGVWSKQLESVGNLILMIFIILAFVFYWWKGGVVYLAFRIPFLFLEVMIGNAILYYAYERKNREIEEVIES
jgi:hypothetical protein